MFRIISILTLITVLSLGAAWLADEPGSVTIDWANYHIETSLLVLLAGIAFLTLCCMLIYYILFALIRTPAKWSRTRLAKRQALGLNALTEAFAAIATQDVHNARKQIGKAQNYLPHQPLTLMLSAQLSRLEGNESRARLYLEQMLKDEGTEFMAIRGLIENARRSRDDETALQYAKKAYALKPQDKWIVTILTGLYVRKNRAEEALQLITDSARRRTLDKSEARRLNAYILYEKAVVTLDEGKRDNAILLLQESLGYLPGFIPASALLAETYLSERRIKPALKMLAATWKRKPHALLTAALLKCYDADNERKTVSPLVAKLAELHPGHRESHFLLASIAFRRHDLTVARSHLKTLLDNQETSRACTLMAEVETAAGDAQEAAAWAKRASLVHADTVFACTSCNQAFNGWQLTCPQCGSVASIQ